MLISLIAAMDEERLIGASNSLPWRLPADMQWFRRQTMGKPILMGRNTFASIGKPLPGRQNIVLSRNHALHIEGCSIIHSLDELKKAAGGADEVMVIGGAEVYGLILPLADRMYLTTIAATFEGDAWFPDFNDAEWREVLREEYAADDLNAWPYCFRILERISCEKTS
ncbi:MAG: type 3 dihydrofolate reductase [Zetaproteobacteria bacterium CG12_big_fil_rev_8_21_14_0_65_55_1124]|nr:MAG: dihydrofolate reductase [Zetaproteobacteria bacterium CG1_02_55_237]PIS19797.1 MAG: type 3 dihydrofolate reductase [Zetaproteobacteria bacterium CG08_land_8_20_14_0_20_55_17]PIW42831.1 MAG: type 3 dihydrofolate reductase [Zetaproteobacteria bacterium CG12_big_fil_rev_8_21_14_0_65_55_1124]PIY51644.1 MAG: type 3 dihydrofolate reductase [Zetaproteobacteria bacterium CG_4_10_14_0_8_um_filter_55_43]PIZ39817.1 MAG: type 3 dihydrofolate reductase [Zetaproteobacteria bacterium CG_4_10_14_0_2_um